MGSIRREDNEKFHAIAATSPELYQQIHEALKKHKGPVEIDIEIRGKNLCKGFSVDVKNASEVAEILRLTTGK